MTSRTIYIVLSACISVAIAYFGAPLLKESKEAVNGLINVFAILAGVLVAVISIIGDPAMLMPGNWRVGFEHAKDTQRKIARHSLLFAVYIASLTILIAAMVCRDANAPSVSESILSYMGVSRPKDCGIIFFIAAFFHLGASYCHFRSHLILCRSKKKECSTKLSLEERDLATSKTKVETYTKAKISIHPNKRTLYINLTFSYT